MNALFGLVFTVAPLAAVGALLAVIVANRRAADEPGRDPGGASVRRVFTYAVAFVALMFAVTGFGMLVGGALEAATGGEIIARRDSELAVALAFTVVGLPAWLLLAVAAQHAARTQPFEQASLARRLYFNGARAVAITGVAVAATGALDALVAHGDIDASDWGWLAAWALTWIVHERAVQVASAATPETRLLDELAAAWGAALGLFTLIASGIAALTAVFVAAYDAALRERLLASPWAANARGALAIAAVGAAIWWWHWRRSPRTATGALRAVQLFLVGVLPAVALAVVPAARALYAALQWWIGDPRETGAAEHFALLPGLAAMLLAGLCTWSYHRRALLLRADVAAEHGEPERVYRYLVSAAGLVVLLIGTTTAFALAIDAFTPNAPELTRRAEWWRNQLVAALTLLAVGAPLWLRYWTDTQRVAAVAPGERGTPSRRVYLFAIFGAAVLATLINLTIVLFQLFEAVLDTPTLERALQDARWSLGVVLTAGAAAWYHWLVLREDQVALRASDAAAPVRAAPRREIVLIAGAEANELARALRAIEGVRLRVWWRAEGSPGPVAGEAQRALMARVAAAPAGRYAIVVGAAGIELIAYTTDEGA
jgi:hypothetical protein